MAVYCHEPMESPGNGTTNQARRVFPRGRLFTHMAADTDEELLAAGARHNLQPYWLQKAGTPDAHFDVTGWRMKNVLSDPKIEMLSLREFIYRVRARRMKAAAL